VGEIEDKVPCRDTYPFEGNWVKENTGSGVEGTLIWTENHTPFMVDRGDWVPYPNRGLVFPVPESVAAIPSPVETSSGFDPAFSLPPFREMDIVGGNKPVEAPDPEDSSTMEKSVVTFSRQRHKESLVGDLVSSPESALSSISPTLDLTLSGDWVPYLTKGLVFPIPESVAAIPSPVETSSGFNPAFSLDRAPHQEWGRIGDNSAKSH
jgi:hypothetical protein